MKIIAKILKKYSFLIGVLLFIFILSRLNFAYYKTLVSEMQVSKLLIIFLINFLFLVSSTFLKSYRWQRLMKAQGIKYSFWQTFLMYQASVYIGMFTPARLGEATRVLYLKENHSLGRGFVSIVLDRMADMLFLLLSGFLGMFLFLDIIKGQILIFGIMIFILLLLIILIFKSNLLRYFLKKIFYYFVPQKYKESWKLNFQDFFSDLKIYKFNDYIFSFFLTLIIWFTYYIVVYLFALEIGMYQVPFLYFFSALSIVSLLTLLPISIAGIGTRDAALLAMFSVFKVQPESTIALSMFILFLTFLVAAVGFFCWLKKPILL